MKTVNADFAQQTDGQFKPKLRGAPINSEFIDFANIDERLGFSEPAAADNPALTEDTERLDAAAYMLGRILTFCVEGKTLNVVGGRILGIALCLRPALFDQRPASEVAIQFGVSKAVLNKYLTSVRQRLGLKPIYAKSEEAIEHYRTLRHGRSTHYGLANANRRYKAKAKLAQAVKDARDAERSE